MARARAIETRLERMVPSLEEFYVNGILTGKDEMREISRHRTTHEYKLVARPLLLIDVENALNFETEIERRVAEFCSDSKVKLHHRWAVVERIERIFRVSIPRMQTKKERKYLEQKYIAFLKRHQRTAILTRYLAGRVQRDPGDVDAWSAAAGWESEQGNHDHARALLQRALRTMDRSEVIWATALDVELAFVRPVVKNLTSDSANKGRKADAMLEQNEALHQIIIELGMAKAVIDSALSPRSKALGLPLVKALQATCFKYSFAAELVGYIARRAVTSLCARCEDVMSAAKASFAKTGGVAAVAQRHRPAALRSEALEVLAVLAKTPQEILSRDMATVAVEIEKTDDDAAAAKAQVAADSTEVRAAAAAAGIAVLDEAVESVDPAHRAAVLELLAAYVGELSQGTSSSSGKSKSGKNASGQKAPVVPADLVEAVISARLCGEGESTVSLFDSESFKAAFNTDLLPAVVRGEVEKNLAWLHEEADGAVSAAMSDAEDIDEEEDVDGDAVLEGEEDEGVDAMDEDVAFEDGEENEEEELEDEDEDEDDELSEEGDDQNVEHITAPTAGAASAFLSLSGLGAVKHMMAVTSDLLDIQAKAARAATIGKKNAAQNIVDDAAVTGAKFWHNGASIDPVTALTLLGFQHSIAFESPEMQKLCSAVANANSDQTSSSTSELVAQIALKALASTKAPETPAAEPKKTAKGKKAAAAAAAAAESASANVLSQFAVLESAVLGLKSQVQKHKNDATAWSLHHTFAQAVEHLVLFARANRAALEAQIASSTDAADMKATKTNTVAALVAGRMPEVWSKGKTTAVFSAVAPSTSEKFVDQSQMQRKRGRRGKQVESSDDESDDDGAAAGTSADVSVDFSKLDSKKCQRLAQTAIGDASSDAAFGILLDGIRALSADAFATLSNAQKAARQHGILMLCGSAVCQALGGSRGGLSGFGSDASTEKAKPAKKVGKAAKKTGSADGALAPLSWSIPGLDAEVTPAASISTAAVATVVPSMSELVLPNLMENVSEITSKFTRSLRKIAFGSDELVAFAALEEKQTMTDEAERNVRCAIAAARRVIAVTTQYSPVAAAVLASIAIPLEEAIASVFVDMKSATLASPLSLSHAQAVNTARHHYEACVALPEGKQVVGVWLRYVHFERQVANRHDLASKIHRRAIESLPRPDRFMAAATSASMV